MFNHSRFVTASALALTATALGYSPVLAAETILIPVGPLQIKIPVSDIESFVKTGNAGPELGPMLANLPPERVQSMKSLLTTRLPLGSGMVEKMLKSPMGPMLLGQMADVLKPPPGSSISGTEAWEKALKRAARSDRLTLLDLIREYPTETVIFDQQVAQQKINTFQALTGGIMGKGNQQGSDAEQNTAGNSSGNSSGSSSGNSSGGAAAGLPSSGNGNESEGNSRGGMGGFASLLLNNMGTLQNLAQSFGLFGGQSDNNSAQTYQRPAIPALPGGTSGGRGGMMQMIQGIFQQVGPMLQDKIK